MLFEPLIDVTEALRKLLAERIDFIAKVHAPSDRVELVKHQLVFFTSIVDRVRPVSVVMDSCDPLLVTLCGQLYSNFIPKLTPEGDLPELLHDGVGKPAASPWELSLPQLHDMICGLEDFQLLRWKLLKVDCL